MEFNSCTNPTVGVEWELQLLNSKTLDLFDGILPLMEFFPHTEFIKPEYIQSCVELNSCIANNSDMAINHIRESLIKVLDRCQMLEMSICGAGTHPFSKQLALITPMPRYIHLEKSAGYLAQTQITFSTHVHVGMHSGDEAIRTMRNLIPAIPAFIALSANSPFWRGHQTEHAAYRHRILAASPSYGLPVTFRDWSDYNDFYNAAVKSGMIKSFKDIHWDIRLHPDFGTLEIRTMDAAPDLKTLLSLVSFARSMAVSMARAKTEDVSRILPLNLPVWFQRENCYRASHHGLNAEFIYNKQGDHRPLRGLVDELIQFCEPFAKDIDEDKNLPMIRKILLDEPSYCRQLESYAEGKSTLAVVENLTTQLLKSNN